MILTCPNCGTQYVVKDGAIPPEGRQVRCAACKHSWHQEPDEVASAATETENESQHYAETQPTADTFTPGFGSVRPNDHEGFAEASLIEPRSGPEAEERAYEEAVIEGGAKAPAVDGKPTAEDTPTALEGPTGDQPIPALGDEHEPPNNEATSDVFSPFADGVGSEPRRRSVLATIFVIVAVVLVLAALFWFFAPPPLKAKLGIATADATPLQVVMSHMDRQQLESGNELLTVTGRVINPTAREQDVPPLQAQLTNRGGKVVYSWTIAPPARSLAGGASASFNSAEIIKSGGDELTITLGQPKV